MTAGKAKALALGLWLALLPSSARTWGERGHHAIARAAALDVLEGLDLSAASAEDSARYAGLRDLFRDKALQLAHLSNIPDTSWRGGDPITRALNAPTHYSDADQWTVNFDTIPLDYNEALAKFQGKPNLVDGAPIDLFTSGTLYWRSQELFELLVDAFKRREPREAILYAGILAHFIGDASMPFHNASDHDGFITGNGGIHAYFETAALLPETPELEAAVYRRLPSAYRLFNVEAKLRQGGDNAGALLAREIGKQAFGRILELRKLDDAFVLERSTFSAQGRKVYAKRKPAESATPVFRPMIEEQLSLSAAVLARLWRAAWEQAGRPDVSRARFRAYLHEPSFIPPVYDPAGVQRLLDHPPRLEERD